MVATGSDSRLVRRSVVQAASRAVSLGLYALAFALVARLLDVDQFASYSAALSLYLIAGALAEFGLQQTTVLELRRRPDEEATVFRGSLLASLLLGAAAMILAGAVTVALLSSEDALAVAFMVPAFVLTRAFVPLAAVRQHRLDLNRLAVADVGGRALTAFVVGVAVVVGSPASPVARFAVVGAALLLGGIVNVACVAGISRGCSAPGSWRQAVSDGVRLARRAVPLGLTNAASFIHVRIDQLIIAAYGLTAGLASYAVAYRVVDSGLGLVTGIGVVSFPLLAAESTSEGRVRLAREIESLLLIVGVGMAVAAFALAPLLVGILGGSAYEDAAPLLRLLCPVILVSVVNLGSAQVAIIQDQARRLLVLAVCFAVANAALNIALVPHVGVRGSAIATIATEVAGAVAVAWVARRSLSGSVQTPAWMAAFVGFAIATWGAAFVADRLTVTVAVPVVIAGLAVAWLPLWRPSMALVRQYGSSRAGRP